MNQSTLNSDNGTTSLYTLQVFRLFERIWHWSQAVSIFTLVFTGLAIHGSHSLISFGTAVTWHTGVAIALLVLWVFATFWLFTTGEWRQYLPRRDRKFRTNLIAAARFYTWGIFKGEAHPYIKTFTRKHNPLQALTYLLVKVVIFPAIWISGIAYLLVSVGQGFILDSLGLGFISIGFIALVHSIAAIAIIMFIIAHLYLLTTGHSFREHVKPMVTGFDEVELSQEDYEFIKTNMPGKIKDQV